MRIYPLVAVALLLLPTALLCADDVLDGETMRPPPNTLGSVDEHGFLSAWEAVDEVEFNDGVSLLVWVHFSSAPGVASPYFGRGWICPLLDSSAMPDDNGNIHVLRPDGVAITMLPDKGPVDAAPATPSKFHSADGRWHGTLAGDGFMMISSADEWVLHFTGGHIQSWKIGPLRTINWLYHDGLVSEIRLTGEAKPGFRLTLDAGGRPEGCVIGDEVMKFKFIPWTFGGDAGAGAGGANGTRTFAGFTIDTADHSPKGADYPFGRDAAGHSTLKFKAEDSHNHEVETTAAWDAATGLVISENDWRYKITPSKNGGALPVIARVNAKGEYEYSAPDPANGRTFARTLDAGDTITTRLLRNGVYGDEIAKVEKAGRDGIYRKIYEAEYDDSGVLTREYKVDRFGRVTDWPSGGGAGAKQVVREIAADKEQELLDAIEKSSAGPQADHEKIIERLASFYILSGALEKAAALLPKLTIPGYRLPIEEQLIFLDTTSDEAKKKALVALETEYPSAKNRIEQDIGKMSPSFKLPAP